MSDLRSATKKAGIGSVAFNFILTLFFFVYYGNLSVTPREIVSEYDQVKPQSQTAANPWHREKVSHNTQETPGKQTKQSNQLSQTLFWTTPNH